MLSFGADYALSQYLPLQAALSVLTLMLSFGAD